MKKTSKNITSQEYLSRNGNLNYLNSNILNNIDAFIFIFDVEEIKPVWINDYFNKKMGYTTNDLKDITSKKFLALFHPTSMKQFMQRMQYYEEETEAIKTVYQVKTKSENWIYLLVCSRIYKRNPDGSIKYLLGYALEVDTYELTRHLRKIKSLDAKCGNISLLNKLSNREMNVIHLIAKGLTDKEIAEKLKISIHTTKTHRKRIISKLGLKNTAALVKYSVENGIS